MPSLETFFFALLGGILPALVWLWFWLHEDRSQPEPRRLIILSFVAGMVAVLLVIPLEQWTAGYLAGIVMFAAWAAIEEIMKFLVAYVVVLRRCEANEPVDMVIYMITVALGFAALENTLFLLGPLTDGNLLESILTGNLRFLGATLLHVLSSASIGVMLAFSFYRKKRIQRSYALVGVILATVLHTAFNILIINSSGEKLLSTFAFVWIGIVVLLLLFEVIKRIKKPFSKR